VPLFESKRKIQELGSSMAITLPAFFVKANEIKKGNVVEVLHGLEGILVVCTNSNPEYINEKLIEIIETIKKES
jgi:antitoxin component of MazEF toxin-antitoxin module